MAFNSYLFLLVFLPVVVALYRLSGARARLWVLVAASLAFFCWGAARALPVVVVSLAFNFAVSRLIVRDGRRARVWLWIGVAANVAVLVGVKYGAFLADGFAAALGRPALLGPMLLPLGLSFYSFQQIAFLVDTARGRFAPAPALTYAASILFFPTIVSGPITYYREFAPQAEAGPAPGKGAEDITVGLVLLAIGLFKKSVIADTMALWVDPAFGAAASGHAPGVVLAWGMVLGFLLQMYFDFSGYSDMALGVARMLGIRLPLNFLSPLRVVNIAEWWRRWHMSLGRFVNEYVFQSLALPLTRHAMGRGLGRWGVHVEAVLVPTALSMFIIGAWHGGAWTFIVFGLLHATYMVVAEVWRFTRGRKPKGPQPRRYALAGNALTLLAVLVALAPFRAADMATTVRIWAGMAGLGGASWPIAIPGGGAMAGAEILVGLLICWCLPASSRLLEAWEPALEWARWRKVGPALVEWRWAPTVGWGLAVGALLTAGLVFISRGSSSFVYMGF